MLWLFNPPCPDASPTHPQFGGTIGPGIGIAQGAPPFFLIRTGPALSDLPEWPNAIGEFRLQAVNANSIALLGAAAESMTNDREWALWLSREQQTKESTFAVHPTDSTKIQTLAALGLNEPVTVRSTGTLPSPLEVGTIYYVYEVFSDGYRLSSAEGEGLLTLSGGSGTHTIQGLGNVPAGAFGWQLGLRSFIVENNDNSTTFLERAWYLWYGVFSGLEPGLPPIYIGGRDEEGLDPLIGGRFHRRVLAGNYQLDGQAEYVDIWPFWP